MKSEDRIPFIEGKAAEFIDKLAQDAQFRAAVESNPRAALAGYVRDINAVPDNPVQLPAATEIAEHRDTILQAWEETCFVGHWPLLYR